MPWLVLALAACVTRTTCEPTRTELAWDDQTPLGTADELFEQADISGEHLGEWDEGRGEVGLGATVDRGNGSPVWIETERVSREVFGTGETAMLLTCTDSLVVPLRLTVATHDGDLAVDVRGKADAIAPHDSDLVLGPMFTGSSRIVDATLPDWSTEELADWDRTTAAAGFQWFDDGTLEAWAGWEGRADHSGSLHRLVTFPAVEP